jgi:hypothetical protein
MARMSIDDFLKAPRPPAHSLAPLRQLTAEDGEQLATLLNEAAQLVRKTTGGDLKLLYSDGKSWRVQPGDGIWRESLVDGLGVWVERHRAQLEQNEKRRSRRAPKRKSPPHQAIDENHHPRNRDWR